LAHGGHHNLRFLPFSRVDACPAAGYAGVSGRSVKPSAQIRNCWIGIGGEISEKILPNEAGDLKKPVGRQNLRSASREG
jgi:hypothetical protein